MRAMVRVAWRPWLYVASEGTMDAYIQSIRDDFRTKLDSDGLHTNWLVSDIIKWPGTVGSSGYAFVMFHMDAGVKTGPSWLFLLPGKDGGAPSEIRRIIGNFNDVIMRQYFRNSSLSVSSIGTTDGSFGFHYNPTGGTSTPYNGGWDANGDLVGGDFDLPSANPYTNLDDFMPSTSDLIGYVFDTLNINFEHPLVCACGHDIPFAALYFQYALLSLMNQFCVAGEIIVPYDATDTRKSGVFQGYFAVATTSNIPTFGGREIWAYNAQGIVTQYLPDYHLLWNDNNTIQSNGEYAWDVVSVYASSHFKGYFHTDVFRNMGRTNVDSLKLFDDGKFIKYHYSMCFPYVEGEPVFPGG